LIVVDQNPDDRFATVLRRFDGAFPIVHLRAEPGVSRARNLGLGHTVADIIGFPDDDCWYAPDLLSRIRGLLAQHAEWDGVAGRVVDEAGNPSAGRSDPRSGLLGIYNLWRRVATAGLFVRKQVIDVVGGFDETLGPAAATPWQAAEDLDYVARALSAGCTICYEPSVRIYHPGRREHASQPDLRQGVAYGAGVGRVLRKNELPGWFAAYSIVRSFGAAGINLLAGRRSQGRFYWAVGRGRLQGWRS
jgi:GT2 family glycosyltransferase